MRKRQRRSGRVSVYTHWWVSACIPAERNIYNAEIKGSVNFPSNIYLSTPSPPTSDADIFSTPSASLPTDTPTRTSIILTVPERPPISGLVHIVVTYDETRARGVRVDVRGVLSMSMDVDGESEEMAEMCRRGGIFGLAGRVWSAGGG